MKRPLINLSIRWRLLITMMALGALFSLSLVILNSRSQQEMTDLTLRNIVSMNREIIMDHGRVTSDNLRIDLHDAIQARDMSRASNDVANAMHLHPEIHRVVLTENNTGMPVLLMEVDRDTARPDTRTGDLDDIMKFTRPVMLDGVAWGTMEIGISTLVYQSRIEQISREMASASRALAGRSIRISLLFLAVGTIIVLVVSTRLAEPVVKLTDLAEQIARGNFDATRRIDTRAGHEIGTLSRAFVKMADDLQKTYQELKRTAEEARNSGAFLDSILEHLPHMIFVKDAADLRILRINKAAEDIIGLPRDKIINQTDASLFAPEQAGFFLEKDRAVLASGKLVDIPEEKLTRRDGSVRYLHTRKIPILEPDGRPKYLLGISEDITGRKSAEQERRLFFNHSMDLMCIASMDGKFEQVNPAFLAVLGYSSEELCTRPYFDFIHPDDLDGTMEAARRLNAGEPVVSFENRYICKDGSIRWLTWNAGINREFKKVYAVARDTTDRRNMEERIFQAGLKEQERIAHDLHDGLGQILTALAYKGKLIEQMLRAGEQALPGQAAEIVALANRASEQARVLARGLDPVVLQEGLVMALRDLAHSTSESFGIECTFNSEEEVDPLDKMTANHLFRIAQEAVNNAIKHGHAGSIQIRLDSLGPIVSLSVENDGLPADSATILHARGLGIHTMNYRAKLIGGALTIQPNAKGAMTVRCTIRKNHPAKSERGKSAT